jgi:1-deoxy-D-xylulose-5-phosphate synthase
MVRTAVEYEDGPIAVRYPRGSGLGVPLDYTPGVIEIGRGEVLRRGKDLTLLAVGSMVDVAVRAAHELEDGGVGASVLSARFVKPLDREMILDEVRRTGAVITLEENVEAGGFGAAVLELIRAEGLSGVRARIMALPDTFVTHGSRDRLLADCGLTSDDVVAAAREMAAGRTSPVSDGPGGVLEEGGSR